MNLTQALFGPVLAFQIGPIQFQESLGGEKRFKEKKWYLALYLASLYLME